MTSALSTSSPAALATRFAMVAASSLVGRSLGGGGGTDVCGGAHTAAHAWAFAHSGGGEHPTTVPLDTTPTSPLIDWSDHAGTLLG